MSKEVQVRFLSPAQRCDQGKRLLALLVTSGRLGRCQRSSLYFREYEGSLPQARRQVVFLGGARNRRRRQAPAGLAAAASRLDARPKRRTRPCATSSVRAPSSPRRTRRFCVAGRRVAAFSTECSPNSRRPGQTRTRTPAWQQIAIGSDFTSEYAANGEVLCTPGPDPRFLDDHVWLTAFSNPDW